MAIQPELTLTFAGSLRDDGFKAIGYYKIGEDNTFEINFDRDAGNWEFSVYTFVSYADGGKHIRIGKSEGPLSIRLRSWPAFVNDALNNAMPRNQKFKGGTPPWEAQGWLNYTVPYNRRGLLFAHRIQTLSELGETKKALRDFEKKLQYLYDPPLCNDTVAGRKLKHAWILIHGDPMVLKKRG
jgi:hypothetical protein